MSHVEVLCRDKYKLRKNLLQWLKHLSEFSLLISQSALDFASLSSQELIITALYIIYNISAHVSWRKDM